ncbi:MAG: gingipain R, partial [Candidatus Cloacimonetes bacterium]|nr:gingipain R [Candidatus Cloacimonadota bacterium]
MNKLFIVLLLCSLIGSMVAMTDMVSANMNAFRIDSKSVNKMQISFQIPDFTIGEEYAGGNTYHRINIDGAGQLLEPGMPELPILATTIAIPFTGSYQIQVRNTRVKTYAQITPYPVQNYSDSYSPKSLTVNDAFYSGTGNYPGQLLEAGQPMIFRDFRIITVQINPFSWDAQSGVLSVYEQLDFDITFNDHPGVNEIYEPLTGISSVWVSMYEALILNFDDYRDIIIANSPPRFIIIHGNYNNTIFNDLVNNYAFWKRQKGANVTVVSTTTTGTSNTQIKNYLQTQYNSPATRPDFIVIVGDTGGSFPVPSWGSGQASGDYQYTHLVGTDTLGDCFIGRISAESNDQLGNVFNKVYLYEKTINVAQANWLEKMLLVGDTSPSGQSTVYNNKYIKELALHLNPNFTFTELYSGDPSPAAMNQAISQGVGFFNYRGYIGMSSWSPSDNLVNGAKLLHAVILTCSTGNFADGLATTESFIRLGSTAQPKGAVTAIGMATASTHTAYNNCLSGAIFAGIFSFKMRTMGEALLFSKHYFHRIFGISNPSAVANNILWCNLMGDPTMEVFTAIPFQYQIDVQSTVHIGTSLLDVQVMNMDGTPAQDACLTISQGTTIISRGFSDQNGQVIMDLPVNPLPGSATITVSGHNYKPLQHTINFDNSGYLIPGTILVTDDNSGNTSGNGDSIANSGETVALQFSIQNSFANSVAGISGYLTTTSPYVTLIDSLVTYPPITNGQVAHNINPVHMQIELNCPDQMMIRMHLILTDNQGNDYDISEFIQIRTAKMGFVSYQIIDTNNSAIDPGETIEMLLTVKNNGTVVANDLFGRLYSLNDLITVPNHTAYYGNAIPASNTVPTTNFTIFARPTILPGMVIPMMLKMYNSEGVEQYVHFSLSIGVVNVNSPLGPDQYGYVIYDDTDTAFEQCPTYQWVGIAPAEGGSGTQLTTINDPYTSTEGDMVGASSLAVVNLPFTFRFYGEDYNQITVCSNGFIALGVTENGEFRNYRLPGAMGPSPMIAPFWDDLATGTGSGIYYYFDRPNSRFIVEWYNMKSGANGSSENTFQVIL